MTKIQTAVFLTILSVTHVGYKVMIAPKSKNLKTKDNTEACTLDRRWTNRKKLIIGHTELNYWHCKR